MRYYGGMPFNTTQITALALVVVLCIVVLSRLMSFSSPNEEPAAVTATTSTSPSTDMVSPSRSVSSDDDIIASLHAIPTLLASSDAATADTGRIAQKERNVSVISETFGSNTADLKAYGNAVGAALAAHFTRQPNQMAAINEFLADEYSPEKAARIEAIASDIERLRNDIGNITPIPELFRPAHDRLFTAYAELGARLRAVARARDEHTLVATMNVYNETVDTVARAYAAISLVYSTIGISFSIEEPGSMFNAQ